MARPELHEFERLVQNQPAPGSSDYPVAIKAKHLDENWKRVTVIESDEDPLPYTVEYTEDGTILRDISGLPPDAIAKQITICENGTPKSYWFVVWDNEPDLPEAATQ